MIRAGKRVVLLAAVLLLLGTGDYRPGTVELAVAPYRFSIVGWELRNLPGKWLRRTPAPGAAIREYFADGRRLRDIRRRIIALEAAGDAAQQPAGDRVGDAGQLGNRVGDAGQLGNRVGDAVQLGDQVGYAEEMGGLRRERERLLERQSDRRPGVEAALEGAVADALRSLGFGGMIGGGVFPPVDTVLTGSPTVLVISPRDRIARLEDVILQTGLTAEERASVEAAVEQDANRSALVVNTGGIAFYPSIAAPDGGLDFTLEIIAHEWVHHWLWFRPLGRRYFQGGDITAINETVADIAGKEISALARLRLPDGALPASSPGQSDGGKQSDTRGESDGASAPSSSGQSHAGKQSNTGEGSDGAPALSTPGQSDGGKQSDAGGQGGGAAPPAAGWFDFSVEMRATRVRVDALLAAGEVAGAEAYMEERRRVFVANGYYIRRLNQAYFAFHGTYATSGAAGISVVGEQVAELRRRSTSLGEFLRTAAQFTGPQDLRDYLDGRQ